MASNGAPEPLLNTDEIAELLGVSGHTVRRLTKQGMPSRVLLSRTRRYYASEVMAWIDAQQPREEDEE